MSHCKGTVITAGGVTASQTLPLQHFLWKKSVPHLLLKGQDSGAVGIYVHARGQKINIVAAAAGEGIVGLDSGVHGERIAGDRML
jgi:hypothetical protein